MKNEVSKTWQERVALVEHYLAVGFTSHFLDVPPIGLEGYPWAYAVSVDGGGMYRYNVPISLHVRAEHSSGLSFRWFVDIEPRMADGVNRLKLDVAQVRRMLELLPEPARESLRSLLWTHITELRKQADEFQQWHDKHRRDADDLEAMARYEGSAASPDQP